MVIMEEEGALGVQRLGSLAVLARANNGKFRESHTFGSRGGANTHPYIGGVGL